MTNLNEEGLWKFSPIPSIEESTFNGVLEKFYHHGISGLTRENIQNSLDGKLPGDNGPVSITINTGKIEKRFIPGFEDIKDRVLCLQGRNNYTKETIEHMHNKLDQHDVDYISFEDSNTKGLKGAMNGQSDSNEDTWSIYAYNKGVHFEEEDTSKEQFRGGSHGIGKIASNAASELYMMYFANCDEYGNKHLGGTVQLIEHKFKENYYRSTGYFTDIKGINENMAKFYPYKNEFHKLFEKDTRGLKIVIPFLREQFNNEKEIIKSICDSFFIAIIRQELLVIVNDNIIDNETIKNYILNDDYYIQDPSEIRYEFTPLYFNTFMNKEYTTIKIADREKIYNFKLYFDYNENIARGRVAIIRTIGMKIEDKKISGNVNKPYNAVLIPDTITEDVFLKSLENEAHTELSFDHIKDQSLQKNAKRFINNISNELSKIIDDAIKRNNPTDGLMNTADILYVVENQFKQDLAEALATVKLNKGRKDLTVVKVKSDIPKKQKPKTSGGGETGKEKKKQLKKVKKNGKDKESIGNKDSRYHAHPDIVDRIIIGDKEHVKFDFSDNKEFKKINICDISLSVVDGMGTEYYNEFNINDNYKNVLDKTAGKNCKIQNNLIKNIEIEKGIAHIELELKEQFNKALKFVYYVEV